MPPSRPGQPVRAFDVGLGIDIAARGDRHFVELLVRVAVEHAQQTVLAADGDEVARLAFTVALSSGLTCAEIPVVHVVGDELLVPQQLAGLHVERDERSRCRDCRRGATRDRNPVPGCRPARRARPCRVERERRPQAAAAMVARRGSFHESAPGSPASGIRLNRQICSPVASLNAPIQFFAPQSAPAGP